MRWGRLISSNDYLRSLSSNWSGLLMQRFKMCGDREMSDKNKVPVSILFLSPCINVYIQCGSLELRDRFEEKVTVGRFLFLLVVFENDGAALIFLSAN